LPREVVDLIRQHYGTSVGWSQALARKAVESGEVRESGEVCSYDPVVIDPVDGPVYLTHDDGMMSVDMMPNAGILRGLGLGIRRRLNKDDLLYWLDRQSHVTPKTAPKKATPKADLVRTAAAALWPEGGVPPRDLTNSRVCELVREEIRKYDGVKVGDSAILITLGRKKPKGD
jgi:hypothetical protein